ncbi:uncharacterized protein SAPINGB_P004231 [Magnusiomyces paraingens]|uniref:Aspartate aminotransferase n=1 Tax=Magnusiomyces paraingens TaxID=2606893 RepID=A0A5E8C0W1_9ASCO|nr:uncharacterized protein SAPINGB_P004231 [Saprochaete ingens]VVT54745.1 unnamed protein product [Saprochaete ingens]
MKTLSPQPLDLSQNRLSAIMSSNSNLVDLANNQKHAPIHKSGFRVDTAPVDPLFGLMARHKADPFPNKVDLGVGAYRDNNGKPWILPSVRKADALISSDPTLNHEYLPIAGLPDFTAGAARLILGSTSPAIAQKRVASVQTISGTGANHLAGLFLARFPPLGFNPSNDSNGVIYVSNPTWANHFSIFKNVGLTVKTYPYFKADTLSLDFEGLIETLSNASPGEVVLLHACAHNPTGIDPSHEQWSKIADVIIERRLFPLFDCAYQGFASGDLDKDAWAVRHFVDRGIELLVCQSFAKNFGLYGERVGALHLITADEDTRSAVHSQLSLLQRSEISNPPAYGARIASRILNNPDLFAEWQSDLTTMSSRIIKMRNALRQELIRLGTPGCWDHIVTQIGMFSFTGLSPAQVDRLVDEFHVYLTRNGRISMAGLNDHNVAYVAKAIDAVVRG